MTSVDLRAILAAMVNAAGCTSYPHDNPREVEELTAGGVLAARLASLFPARAERGIRVFGFTALAIGLPFVSHCFPTP